jgi:hypothetical protein
MMAVQLFFCCRDHSWWNRLSSIQILVFWIGLTFSILANGYIGGFGLSTSNSVLSKDIVGTKPFRSTSTVGVYHLDKRRLASKKSNNDISKTNHEICWNEKCVSRRLLLLQGAAVITTTPLAVLGLAPSEVIETTRNSNTMFLQRRLQENLVTLPYYGMQNPDIFYPSYFTGVWEVTSTCTDIQNPVPSIPQRQRGENETTDEELGKPYRYRVRFIPHSNSEHSIADREYNVKEILTAYGTTTSLLDISLATPNQFTCTLSLPTKESITSNKEGQQQRQLVTVDILTLARKQEQEDVLLEESTTSTAPMKLFGCSEVVRQIVAPVSPTGDTPILTSRRSTSSTSTTITTNNPFFNVKDIETISLYSYTDSGNSNSKDSINPSTASPPSIQCRQRTATYLVPSTTDPVALKMWQATQGKPIEVRFYDVLYTKISNNKSSE